MPNRGSSSVAQRRFWNNLVDTPGIIWINAWNFGNGCNLFASKDGSMWEHVYHSSVFDNGPAEFPVRFKLYRFWKLTWEDTLPGQLMNLNPPNVRAWVFKPYSTKFTDGRLDWLQGDDWDTANLFFDSSPYMLQRAGRTSLQYHAICDSNPIYGWGAPVYPPPIISDPTLPPSLWSAGVFYNFASNGGGLLYGYLNDQYFGVNQFGGNKSYIGIQPKFEAWGDLSKVWPGLWGAFGITAGVTNWGDTYHGYAEWVFDLCDRPENMRTGAVGTYQSEGWGVDSATIVYDPDTKKRHFTLAVSPGRSTLHVYRPDGQMLLKAVQDENGEWTGDWRPDPCDTTGRVYEILFPDLGGCDAFRHVIVEYLVVSRTLPKARRNARTIDTNEAHDRQGVLDVRGF